MIPKSTFHIFLFVCALMLCGTLTNGGPMTYDYKNNANHVSDVLQKGKDVLPSDHWIQAVKEESK